MYIIKNTDFPPLISLENRKATLVEIPVTAVLDISYRRGQYLDDIVAKVAEGLNEGDLYLLVNMMRIGDAARFVTLERKEVHLGISSGATVTIYGGIDEYERLPIEFEEVFTEEVFRNFYYELDYDKFDAFWNGWRRK